MENEREQDDYLAILHPELMAKDDLLHELMQRKVKEPGMRSMDKNDLVALFYKTVVPMPQRKYRMNRRGKLMTRHQILMSKRKRSHAEANPQSASYEVTSIYSKGQERDRTNSSSRLISSFNQPTSSPAGDRLKPPPSATTGERKIIKLKSKSENSSDSTNTSEIIKLGTTNTTTPSSVTSKRTETNLTKVFPINEGHDTSVSKPIKIKRHNHNVSSTDTPHNISKDIPVAVTSTDSKNNHENRREQTIFEKEKIKNKEPVEEPVVKKFKKISITWP